MVNLNTCKQKALIDYPLFWEYKIIIEKAVDIEKFCKEFLAQKEVKYEFSHSSKNDKYRSFLLKIFVHNEEERLEIFELLKLKSKFVI